jgi:hypothetical protein
MKTLKNLILTIVALSIMIGTTTGCGRTCERILDGFAGWETQKESPKPKEWYEKDGTAYYTGLISWACQPLVAVCSSAYMLMSSYVMYQTGRAQSIANTEASRESDDNEYYREQNRKRNKQVLSHTEQATPIYDDSSSQLYTNTNI